MLKHTATTAAALALLIPATALGAQHHSFTLRQAHQAAAKTDIPGMRVYACHWASARMADCPATFNGTIVDGTQPLAYSFTLTVERDGGCPTRRAGNGTGIVSGVVGSQWKWHGCDRGPLTVAADSPVQTG